MTYNATGPGALDYLPCRYGKSKLLFRGPKRRLDAPYAAFIGGTETYGKFIKVPFPALIEEKTGMTCVNLGIPNAGVDAFVKDEFALDAGRGARTTVVQVMGAQNLSNRFYAVHPRRNDRFVGASDLLATIYRDVDFSEFHFTRHMLNRLYAVSADRFETVQSELQAAWVARMRFMLGKLTGKIVLLWFAPNAPDPAAELGADPTEGKEPLFVTRSMMDQVSDMVTEVVEVVATPNAIAQGTEGMYFGELETPAAAEMLGPDAHAEVAAALCPIMERLM